MGENTVEVKHNVTRRNAEVIFSVALMLASIVVYVEAGRYPDESAGYPKFLAVLLGVFSLLGLCFQLLSQSNRDNVELFFLNPLRAAIGFLSLCVYVVLLEYFGYIIPSLLFCTIVPVLIGYRNFRVIIPLAVISIVLIIIVFHIVLERPLPPDVLDSLIKAFS